MTKYYHLVTIESEAECATVIAHQYAEAFADMGLEPVYNENNGEVWLLEEADG